MGAFFSPTRHLSTDLLSPPLIKLAKRGPKLYAVSPPSTSSQECGTSPALPLFSECQKASLQKKGLRDEEDGGTKSISENCPPLHRVRSKGKEKTGSRERAKGHDTGLSTPSLFFVPPATTPPVGIFTNSFFSRQKLPQRQQNQSLQPGATLKLHGLFASARMVRAKCQRVRFGERDDGAAVAVSARCKKALFFSLLFFGKRPSPPFL